MNMVMKKIESLLEREGGQTMAEYAIILAVIALAVIAAIELLSGNISTVLGDTAAQV